MPKIILKANKISNIQFKNTLANGTKLELSNKYSYNVKYGQNNMCEGFLSVEIKDKNGNDNFYISLTVQGLFQFEPSSSREELHVASFKELFPYARVFVQNLTVMAGMPPIIIPPIDMENQEIYRIDMKPNNEQ